MPSLFENAVASIRMGVEDFQLEDDDRDISAVRNLYAGVLLLAKEALVRKAPNADPREVIGAAFRPVPDGQGDVTFVPANRTIDFQELGRRFKDFGLTLDIRALADLNEIRNDMEHHFTDKPGAKIRAAFVKAFPVVSGLFRQMGETPSEQLGEAWDEMIAQHNLYAHERAEAVASFAKVVWFAPFLDQAPFLCDECGLDLIEQTDPDNTTQDAIQFRCRKCAAEPTYEIVIARAVEAEYATTSLFRYKDGDLSSPTFDCTECGQETYLASENKCACCGYVLDFKSSCARCHTSISIQDYMDGADSGLCGYCQQLRDKVMAE